MNNEIVEEKKNNTNKILIAIIIILLLLLGGLSYYTFFVRNKEADKPNPVVEPTKPIESTDSIVEPTNPAESTKPIESTDSIVEPTNPAESTKPIENETPLDTKEKEYDVTYNNTTHKIKVVENSFLNANSDFYLDNYNINTVIYLDNEVLSTIDSTSPSSDLGDYIPKAYIFDSKYLGLLIEDRRWHTSYSLYVYNNMKLIGEENIIMGGQTIAETPDSEALNTLEKIEFDGHELLFWGMSSCIDKANDKLKELLKEKSWPTTGDAHAFGKYALTIKNDKINWNVADVMVGTGGSGASC